MKHSNVELDLLNEILMTPSHETAPVRFQNLSSAAACSGRCQSGQCMAVISDLSDCPSEFYAQ